MKRLRSLVLIALIAACEFSPVETNATLAPDDVPALNHGLGQRAGGGPSSIPGQFIVTLRRGVEAESVAGEYEIEPTFTYQSVINGFSGSIAAAAREGLMRDARVLRIEPDQMMFMASDVTQSQVTWGLDRVDQRQLPLDGAYSYNRTGDGVTAYIVDSGIRFSHHEFGDRAQRGIDLIGDGEDGGDCNGHGTHVAGSVGGTLYGVAKGVTLVSVRVFGCSGGTSVGMIVAGLDWIDRNGTRPGVVNMSLGGGASDTLDDAVRASVANGFSYTVAAGNGDWRGRQVDACRVSPARVAEAMTISAANSGDEKASWANFGDCVDYLAPGVSITSAWIGSNSATRTISGTSMAAPHAAGVAALYLEANPEASAFQVFQALRDGTTKGVVTRSSTAKNDLLFSRITSGGGDGQSGGGNDSGDDGAGGNDDTEGVEDDSGNDDGGGNDEGDHDDDADEEVAAITLSANAYKVRGLQKADITWNGASTGVTIFRDGSPVSSGSASGSFTDNIDVRGGGSYLYKVCETGSASICSAEVTVSF